MIYDLKQPAKNWLADQLKNFGDLLDNGNDPSCEIEIDGIKVEIRLNLLPGVYQRHVCYPSEGSGV